MKKTTTKKATSKRPATKKRSPRAKRGPTNISSKQETAMTTTAPSASAKTPAPASTSQRGPRPATRSAINTAAAKLGRIAGKIARKINDRK